MLSKLPKSFLVEKELLLHKSLHNKDCFLVDLKSDLKHIVLFFHDELLRLSNMDKNIEMFIFHLNLNRNKILPVALDMLQTNTQISNLINL
jgi:hypothetical protein